MALARRIDLMVENSEWLMERAGFPNKIPYPIPNEPELIETLEEEDSLEEYLSILYRDGT